MEDYTEEDLFEDVGGVDGAQNNQGALSGEYADDVTQGEEGIGDGVVEQEGAQTQVQGSAADEELSGIELFLSNYGVRGGMIQYEDGEAVHFNDLAAQEQEEVLQSLTGEAIPTIEEKYNLEDSEINLLNILRESEQSPEEFINNLVDYRLGTILAQRDANSVDFENMPSDSLYIRHLIDTNPDMTDDEIADELEKAKGLATFESTVDALKVGYMALQKEEADAAEVENNNAFYEELERQREQVVQTVERIDDIAGAAVTDDMKEYLLHDIMELNEERDPILMEKIFSNPETMFEVNWFLTYGKDYIKGINDYWRKEVSKATKNGYNKAVRGMPGEPIRRSGDTVEYNNYLGSVAHREHLGGYGEVASEEDLFE